MERDIDKLQALYEQILISEDAEISKYGYSKEFIKALYSTFNIPHDATFVKLTKMPYTSEMDDKYRLVIAKIKDKVDDTTKAVAVMGGSIHEFNGESFRGRITGFDFSTIRSAVDKNTIYGALKTNEVDYRDSWNQEREGKRKEKLNPIYTGIFDLLQSKFGDMFHKRIEDLKEYIYTNIRKIKLTASERKTKERGLSWGRRETDIEQVINILLELDKIKNQSKESLTKEHNSEYSGLCNEVIKEFLIKYGVYNKDDARKGRVNDVESFVTYFNKYPSYANLGKVFLKALDTFENKVLDLVHSDDVDGLI